MSLEPNTIHTNNSTGAYNNMEVIERLCHLLELHDKPKAIKYYDLAPQYVDDSQSLNNIICEITDLISEYYSEGLGESNNVQGSE